MNEVEFEKLESAIQQPGHAPIKGARLVIASMPMPFVAPTLLHGAPAGTDPFAAEIVFVQASAAVGKSTMAKYLSTTKGVPLLDLSVVPVSTGSLKSLVSDLAGSTDPVKAFHLGELPIIVDALDEGRLLSSETGFESFLQTTAEFILQDRSVTDRAKLIIFGRHDSVADAVAWFELTGIGVTTSIVEVGFFAEEEARQLIDGYASASAAHDAAYRHHPGPARELVNAYFSAIEAALGLQEGQLWTDEQGRAFAGYAPVLAALGSLLAEMDNFQDVAIRLKAEGRQEVWSVIATVLDEILRREKKKLCDKLAKQISVPVPEEVYDAQEQLTFLVRHVHRQALGVSNRVKLPASDLVQYHTMVQQYISDHPFVRQGVPTNAVLGSLILAHAVVNDLLIGSDLRLLAELSRQPFLWRSLRSRIESAEDILLDGRYLGYALNSFWNDPNTKDPRIVVRSIDEDLAEVRVPTESGKILALRAALPIQFYGQMRDCDVNVQGGVTMEGHATGSTGPAFYVYGETTVLGEAIKVFADTITIDGGFWLEGTSVTSSPRLAINTKKSAEVGWGGAVAANYPWNSIAATLTAPYATPPGDVLTSLITECSLRLPDRVLVVFDTYRFSDAENRWAARNFPQAFPRLLKLLIKHNLATAEKFGTYAQNKFRIHMNTRWADLRTALAAPATDPQIRAFVEEARLTITIA